MKLEWINSGKEFILPKIKVGMDIDILTYMVTEVPKELPDNIKRLMEFRETVYRVLNLIDKNVTREKINEELSTDELGALYLLIRMKGVMRYTCPHCNKSFRYEEMPENKPEGDIPLPDPKNDSTVTKEGT